jgi:hypothetical protein
MISQDPAMPVHWGKNQPGMQAKEEVAPEMIEAAKTTWLEAAKNAVSYAKTLAVEGLHKQIVNRVTEPFVTMKTVVTATEWENFFNLRYHPDAQPEIFELAKLMCHARDCNQPKVLELGEWHLPYVISHQDMDLEECKKISASCCAQVSYRKNDDSFDKALAIYQKLIESKPCHASPVEHQATPMPSVPPFTTWPQGITHRDRVGRYWSNNFMGWIQNRALLGI